jgi:mycothiol system anti-sigma-R factor
MAEHNCDEAIGKLYEFLDDELTWFRKARVRYHLRNCPPCDKVFVFEEHLRAVIRERARDDPPAEVLDRLRRMIREAGAGPGV